jgi:hypothetical protein
MTVQFIVSYKGDSVCAVGLPFQQGKHTFFPSYYSRARSIGSETAAFFRPGGWPDDDADDAATTCRRGGGWGMSSSRISRYLPDVSNRIRCRSGSILDSSSRRVSPVNWQKTRSRTDKKRLQSITPQRHRAAVGGVLISRKLMRSKHWTATHKLVRGRKKTMFAHTTPYQE